MEHKEILEESIKSHQQAIDNARAKLAEIEVTYSVGDRFMHNGDKYILTATSKAVRHVQMTCLQDGCYHCLGFVAENPRKISLGELNTAYRRDSFKRYWDDRNQVRV